MTRLLRRWSLHAGAALLGLMAAAGLYVGVAMMLMLWPATSTSPQSVDAVDAAPPIEAYVLSNGVHTDYAFPIRSTVIDWTRVFAPTDAPEVPPDAEYIAIGWGDREFYLNTPTWADLTVARAFGALSGRNRALLHVTWLRRAQMSRGAYALPLSATQYARLVTHVRTMLPGNVAAPIAGAHYGREDAFYEALGSYSAIETCNTWTGRGLRQAGIATGRWTPFDLNVVWHLAPTTP
ncbi:MAG: TIGR02117 family protein [Pseudomonadota bacterium]